MHSNQEDQSGGFANLTLTFNMQSTLNVLNWIRIHNTLIWSGYDTSKCETLKAITLPIINLLLGMKTTKGFPEFKIFLLIKSFTRPIYSQDAVVV